MCTVLLSPGVNTTAVNNIYHITHHKVFRSDVDDVGIVTRSSGRPVEKVYTGPIIQGGQLQ